MTTHWQGPNLSSKLRADLEKAVLEVAKARHAATGAPVMISLELEYFGFNVRRDPAIRRLGEYNNFIRIVDETKPRQLGKGDGRGKAAKHSQTRIPSAATDIPKGWIAVPPKLAPEAKQ